MALNVWKPAGSKKPWAHQVEWECPFCTKRIDEHAACCGEIGRAVQVNKDEDEE